MNDKNLQINRTTKTLKEKDDKISSMEAKIRELVANAESRAKREAEEINRKELLEKGYMECSECRSPHIWRFNPISLL